MVDALANMWIYSDDKVKVKPVSCTRQNKCVFLLWNIIELRKETIGHSESNKPVLRGPFNVKLI